MEVNEQGKYVNRDGNIFIKCYADPSSCLLIDVTGPRIESIWRGRRYWIDFSMYLFCSQVVDAAYEYVCDKLQDHTPAIVNEVKSALKMMAVVWKDEWKNFSSLSWHELFEMFATASKSIRLCFRKFYTYCADNGLAQADEIYAAELNQIAVGSPSTRVISDWDKKRGALTNAELELVRRAMLESGNESWDENVARLFVWISFETLKRPMQISSMDIEALWSPPGILGEKEFFLRIPKIKYNAGQPSDLWPITAELANEILEYGKREGVSECQKAKGRLIVTSKPGTKSNFDAMIKNWSRKKKIISPRTNEILILTPYRIRHSGATQMAMQGCTSEEIRYVLEHKSLFAVNAYIDCLVSDFCPLLDRVGRKLGGIFSELTAAFFAGKIAPISPGNPILIPVIAAPAVVGSCGSQVACTKHPFFSCYNGCPFFIAWKDADHYRSLNYIEAMLNKWNAAINGSERSKVLKELERVYQSITDVIVKIEAGD